MRRDKPRQRRKAVAPVTPPPFASNSSSMRAAIGKRLLESSQSIPHYRVAIDVECGALLARVESSRAAGLSIAINDLMVRATALALRQHPSLNSHLIGDEVLDISRGGHLHRRRDRQWADGARDTQRGCQDARADRIGDQGTRAARTRGKFDPGGHLGGHLHDLQSRHVRRRPLRCHHQSAPGRYLGDSRGLGPAHREVRSARRSKKWPP